MCASLYKKQVGLFPVFYYTTYDVAFYFIKLRFNSCHYFAVVVMIFVLDLVFPNIDPGNLRYKIVHGYPIDLPFV
ncbi:MAG: hypothetical protein ACI90V_012310 [Bacillariaceae sp.]|jgi:hypothetical protein